MPHPNEASATLSAALNALTRPKRRPASDKDLAIMTTATRFDTEFEDGIITRWHWGSHGPHVLLVHGWESRASHWYAWIEALLQCGMQVSAIDLPAHGFNTAQETDVVHCGKAVLTMFEGIPQTDALIGHSMGSAACLYALAQGANVKASIHLAGPSSLTRVIAYVAHACQLSQLERNALYAAMDQRTGNAVEKMDLKNLQPGLRHPSLIYHDLEDQEMPFLESEDLHNHWPQSRLIPLSGVGHRQILKDTHVINQSLGWLSGAI